jgi:uncharacterized protein (DUF427 family)
MSLTIGSGPLAGHPGGAFNFRLDGAPRHRIFFEDYPRRLRAVVGGRVVLDTTRAKLLHETGILAVPYVPLEDVDPDVLERTGRSTHCPFKGDASYWTVRVGERVLEDALWGYEAPMEGARWLAGHVALYWDRADAWYVEEERVFAHLRDPYHRVDVLETSRRARVSVNGTVVARTDRAKLLYETSLPVRVYVPPADIAPGALAPSEKRTRCPYKGEATYWSVAVDGHRVPDGAFSYEAPLPDALKVQGHVSFHGEGVEVELDEPGDRFRL